MKNDSAMNSLISERVKALCYVSLAVTAVILVLTPQSFHSTSQTRLPSAEKVLEKYCHQFRPQNTPLLSAYNTSEKYEQNATKQNVTNRRRLVLGLIDREEIGKKNLWAIMPCAAGIASVVCGAVVKGDWMTSHAPMFYGIGITCLIIALFMFSNKYADNKAGPNLLVMTGILYAGGLASAGLTGAGVFSTAEVFGPQAWSIFGGFAGVFAGIVLAWMILKAAALIIPGNKAAVGIEKWGIGAAIALPVAATGVFLSMTLSGALDVTNTDGVTQSQVPEIGLIASGLVSISFIFTYLMYKASIKSDLVDSKWVAGFAGASTFIACSCFGAIGIMNYLAGQDSHVSEWDQLPIFHDTFLGLGISVFAAWMAYFFLCKIDDNGSKKTHGVMAVLSVGLVTAGSALTSMSQNFTAANLVEENAVLYGNIGECGYTLAASMMVAYIVYNFLSSRESLLATKIIVTGLAFSIPAGFGGWMIFRDTVGLESIGTSCAALTIALGMVALLWSVMGNKSTWVKFAALAAVASLGITVPIGLISTDLIEGFSEFQSWGPTVIAGWATLFLMTVYACWGKSGKDESKTSFIPMVISGIVCAAGCYTTLCATEMVTHSHVGASLAGIWGGMFGLILVSALIYAAFKKCT